MSVGTKRSGTRLRSGWLVALAALLLPTPALAARLTAVRVGVHAGYARVVLETDAPAQWEVLDAASTAPDEVAVRIVATSRAREVRSAAPGSPAVALLPQPDGSTLARIRGPGPLRVETQVLASPPRVVLDLRRAENAATPPAIEPAREPSVAAPPLAAPEPIAIAKSEPRPEPAPDAAPAPEPSPVATAPLPPVDAPPPVSAPARSNALDTRSLALGFALGLGLALVAFASRRRSSPLAERAPATALDSEASETEAFEPLPPPPEAPELSPHELENIAPFPRHSTTPSLAVPEPLDPPEPTTDLPDATLPRSEPQASGEVHQARCRAPTDLPDATLPRSEPQASGEVHELDLLRMHQRLDARLAEIADKLDALIARQTQLEARGEAQNEEIASQRAAIARLQRSLRPAATQARPLQVP